MKYKNKKEHFFCNILKILWLYQLMTTLPLPSKSFLINPYSSIKTQKSESSNIPPRLKEELTCIWLKNKSKYIKWTVRKEFTPAKYDPIPDKGVRKYPQMPDIKIQKKEHRKASKQIAVETRQLSLISSMEKCWTSSRRLSLPSRQSNLSCLMHVYVQR